MTVDLPVKQMTVEEKLRAMEVLWEDLRQNAANVPVPQWHKDLLEDREQLVRQGKAHYSDWDSAKKRIANRIRED